MEIAQVSFPIQSVLGDLFRSHQRKEIGTDTFQVGNAFWVEKNCYSYPVLQFPVPPGAAVSYVNRRLSGQDYDQSNAKILGEWFLRCVRIGSLNDANISLLRWAKEILAANGGSPKIDRALEDSKLVSNYTEFFNNALEVKRRDADRPRGSK